MKNQRIAITGATGFIGSAVLRALLRNPGCEAAVLLRPGSDRRRLPVAGFTEIGYETLHDEHTLAVLKAWRPDVLIHCAWRGVGGADRNQSFQITENVPLTVLSVQLAADAGCRQWIGLGSQAEYGNLNARLDEKAPARPTTLYGEAKLAAGTAALALCEARRMTGAWLRVFSTYGPDDSPSWFIPYIIQELLAGRTPRLTACGQLWDYLYVEDAAAAVCSTAWEGAGGIFNLGSGRALPLKTFVETIRDVMATRIEPAFGAVPYRPDQVMHLEADITRLTAATGWQPATSLAQGIAATVEFERTRNFL